MSERYVYQERNIKELMHYYLTGRVALAEEIRMANIQYYESGELEEPQDQELTG